ncbi:hypothetical protein M514_03998 [Trichuris suis]|uniref:EGF-like domain-containing protein n=1 Tax=Trichuris suis TaxID=68888 RepID=A0A085NSW6_9BILA|nr:hypothetical protein M513_03998 [Trichuris suis]KFD72562.1 hypothetical protein M514_03998 [Trichuris suis]
MSLLVSSVLSLLLLCDLLLVVMSSDINSNETDECQQIEFPLNLTINSTLRWPSGWPVNVSCPLSTNVKQKICWWFWHSNLMDSPQLLVTGDDLIANPGRTLEVYAAKSVLNGIHLICAVNTSFWTFMVYVTNCSHEKEVCRGRGKCISLYNDGPAPLVSCECKVGYGQFCERTIPLAPFICIAIGTSILFSLLAICATTTLRKTQGKGLIHMRKSYDDEALPFKELKTE